MGPIAGGGVSVVLGTYNRLPYLKMAISSIRSELTRLGGDNEIIVVDGGSTDRTVRWLTAQKDIITIVQHNKGEFNGKPVKPRSWGYFMNLAFRAASGKYVCMLSDDCIVLEGAISNARGLLEEKTEKGEKVGAAAFYYRDYLEEDEYKVNLLFDRVVNINHGLFLNSALHDAGYAEASLYEFYWGDFDLTLKLYHKGYQVIESPDSYVEHFHRLKYHPAYDKTTGGNIKNIERDKETFLERWGSCFPGHKAISVTKRKYYRDLKGTASVFISKMPVNMKLAEKLSAAGGNISRIGRAMSRLQLISRSKRRTGNGTIGK